MCKNIFKKNQVLKTHGNSTFISNYELEKLLSVPKFFFEEKVIVKVKENDYDIALECDDDADIAIVYRQSLFLSSF